MEAELKAQDVGTATVWWGLVLGAAVSLTMAGCKHGLQGEEAVSACQQGGSAEACSNACDYLYEGKRYASLDDMQRSRQLLADVCAVSCRATGKATHCQNAKTGF